MITSLTQAQKDRFPEFIEKWTRIGLCTEPSNRPEAENAIKEAYVIAGLNSPLVVWCSSPLAMCLANCIREKLTREQLASVRDSVWDSVWDSVRDSVWDSVGDSVRDSVWGSVWDSVAASVGDSVRGSVAASVGDSVRDSVWGSVWDSVAASVGDSVRGSVGASVRDSVGDSVWDSVAASVGASVWDSVGDSVWGSVHKCIWGQHDANWLGFYDFFREECNLTDQTKKLSGLTRIAQASGWLLPMRNICWASERHNRVFKDQSGRLHCENGSACGFPDGWGVWAWHGVRVPRYVIEQPSEITIKSIQEESNAEVRRVLIERYGQGRYITDSGAKEIHRDDFGILYIQPITNDEPLVMVKVVNSTPEPDGQFRDYFIRVPPQMKRAREAVAWTFGKQENEYAPCLET